MTGFEGLNNLANICALEILSSKIPIESFTSLNEPIDMFCINAKDAPQEKLGERKSSLMKETGWPDSIINECRTEDEVKIYRDANLEVETVNEKDCLIRTDIDYDKIIDGQTNLERMKCGKCPISDDGQKIELHHIGQNPNAPLAELKEQEHRGKVNDMILHDKTIEESLIDRYAFREERESHWIARAEIIERKRNIEQ